MRVLVCGAGAVGSYMVAYLALARHDVTLLTYHGPVGSIGALSLTLNGAAGKRTILNLRVAETFQEALEQAQPYEAFIFTRKAFETVGAILEIERIGLEPPPILCLQHGVGNEDSLIDAFGQQQVASGVLLTPVSLSEPSVVVEGHPYGLALALDSPVALLFVEAFRSTALAVTTTRSAASLKWSKLLVDMIANATAASLDIAPIDTLSDARLLDVELEALREAQAILRLQGIEVINLPGMSIRRVMRAVERLPGPLARPLLSRLVRRRQIGSKSSLRADIEQGRGQTEVAWLNGAVVQAAEGMRRLAPINHALALIVSDIASGRIAWDVYRHKPDVLLTAVRMTQGPSQYLA